MRFCTVDDCDKPRRSSRSPYCEMHYYRLRRNGTLTANPWHRHGTCTVDGCGKPEDDSGMCAMHATRVRRHGDPLINITHDQRKWRVGADNPSWAGDQVTYYGAHQRVVAAKGRASQHACVDCGQTARHWSYDRTDPDEIGSPEGPFSASPDHYQPRCVPCHKQFDLAAISHSRETA